jgi:hypothetical protein
MLQPFRSINWTMSGEPKADKIDQEESGENGSRKHWHLRLIM